jgi:hypothetical protein
VAPDANRFSAGGHSTNELLALWATPLKGLRATPLMGLRATLAMGLRATLAKSGAQPSDPPS